MSTSNDTNNKLKSPKSLLLAMALLSLWVTGCTQIVAPIDAIPAARVPKELLVQATNNTRSLDFTRLRRPAEREYKIDKGDVLGIFIDGVLGNTNESPPIQLQSAESDLPPAIGYPYPVRDNGTLPLPLISPIYVTGMTIAEAEAAIKRAYADAGVLKKVEDKPEITDETDPTETKKAVPADISEVRTIVTLMKRRTYRVLVIRQDNFAAQNDATAKRSDRPERHIPGVELSASIRRRKKRRAASTKFVRRPSRIQGEERSQNIPWRLGKELCG